MIINMGSGGENLKKEITEQNELIESIRKLYVGLKWTHEKSIENMYSIAELDGELFAVADAGFYKWNGTDWIHLDTLNVNGDRASLVNYNGELHLLGGVRDDYRHIKWSGTEWVSVGSLPTSAPTCKAIVYGGKIHIFTQVSGSYVEQSHYSYDGTSWTEEVAFDKDASFDVVVLDDKLYAITNSIYLYREGQEWDEYLKTPAWCQKACVYDGELYIATSEGLYRLDSEHWVKMNSPMTADASTRMIAVGDELVMMNSVGHAGGVFDGL
jgi:hypothetical protein